MLIICSSRYGCGYVGEAYEWIDEFENEGNVAQEIMVECPECGNNQPVSLSPEDYLQRATSNNISKAREILAQAISQGRIKATPNQIFDLVFRTELSRLGVSENDWQKLVLKSSHRDELLASVAKMLIEYQPMEEGRNSA